MNETSKTSEDKLFVAENKTKQGSIFAVIVAFASAIFSLVLLFLPWFKLSLENFELQSNALQLITGYLNINEQAVHFPLSVKITLALAIIGLLAFIILFFLKKYMYAGVSALTGMVCMTISSFALSSMKDELAAAAGLTLGIEDQAFVISGAFSAAIFLALLAAIIAFLIYSSEIFAMRLFNLAALVSIAMVFVITLYLLILGLPAILKIGPLNFIFGTTWAPTHAEHPSFGIWYMILASVFATFGAVLIGVPIGVLTAIFLAEVAPARIAKVVRPAVELLAGIPSVIYGFFAMQLIVPFVQTVFKLPSGATLMSSIIVLAIMILPTIITTAETGLRAVPEHYKEASLALGASQTRTIFKVLLPAATAPVLSGVILGVGRAIGETMAIIMVAGGTASFPKLLGPVRPLTVGIVMEMSYASGLHRDSLFAIGLVLFVFIMLVNITFTKIAGKGVKIDGKE